MVTQGHGWYAETLAACNYKNCVSQGSTIINQSWKILPYHGHSRLRRKAAYANHLVISLWSMMMMTGTVERLTTMLPGFCDLLPRGLHREILKSALLVYCVRYHRMASPRLFYALSRIKAGKFRPRFLFRSGVHNLRALRHTSYQFCTSTRKR